MYAVNKNGAMGGFLTPDDTTSLVDFIYRAGEGEPSAIAELQEALRRYSDAATIDFAISVADGVAFEAAFSRLAQASGLELTDRFLGGEAWSQAGRAIASMKPLAAASQDADAELLVGLYSRHLLPLAQGQGACLGCVILAPSGVLVIALRRTRVFSVEDTTRLQELVPHLRRMHVMRARLQTLEAAFDQLVYPTILVNGDREIMAANAAAKTMLELKEGLYSANGRLQVASAASRRLSDAVTLAVAMPAGQSDTFLMPFGTEARNCRIIVSPLTDRRAAMVVVDDPALHHDSVSRVAKLYGLSVAEVALANALMHGESLEIFAKNRDVRITTVRSQLSSLLRKTNTERQPQLIASLARIPAIAPEIEL